jgi:hypothetical protein
LGRYDPLRAYLSHQPSNIDKLSMTFKQVEQMVGKLPQAARKGKAWWRVTIEGTVKADRETRAWLVGAVTPETETVTFVRDNAATIRPGSSAAVRDKPPSRLSRRALAADLLVGLVAGAATGAVALTGLTHLPVLAIALLSVAIGGLAFTITQAVNSRKLAEASRSWWAGSTSLALAISVGALSYHAWFDPSTRPPTVPFTVSVLVDPPTIVDESCRPIFIPGPWGHVPVPHEPLTMGSIKGWIRSQHAVDGKFTAIALQVQGRSQQAVAIDQPLIVVRSRQAPVRGSVAELSGGCGGLLQHRVFTVNLDQQNPITKFVAGAPYPDLYHGNKASPQASSPSFTVSEADPEYFVVLASTADYLCRWSVELTWASDGHSGTMTIDDHNTPFTTTATGNDPTHFLIFGNWES